MTQRAALELSRKDSLCSLLLDELAYRLVRYVHDRAHARRKGTTPLFAPTTDIIGHRLVSTGVFEHTQIDALDALIEGKGGLADRLAHGHGIFIDIGANIGVYTVRYASKFDRVLAIEANPITFDVLKSNVALSQSSNVSTICVGASDRRGTMRLKIPKDGVMGWASFEDVNEADRVVEVPVKTIDQIAEEAGAETINLMKIDVEGHEASVLRGSQAVLANHKPVVLYEQLNRRAGVKCADLLRAAGYENFVAFTRKANPFLPFAKCPVNAYAIDPAKVDRCALICAY